jgi:hypothetical protein
MSQDLDDLIAKKEVELYPFSAQMEKLKVEFLEETVRFAREWYKKTTKEYIIKYPEVTLKMKEDNIAQMKSKVNDLVGNTEKTVKSAVDKSAVWWHKKPVPDSSIEQYTQMAEKYPVVVDCAVRVALGHLGAILQDFGFHVTVSGNTGEFGEFWFMHPPNTELTLPFYPHLLEWSKEMQEIVSKYRLQYVPALAIYSQIYGLKEEKKRQQALARWDSL